MKMKRVLWIMIYFFILVILSSCSSNDSSPQESKYLTDVKAITAGWSNTVVLKDDGTLWGWGYNGAGQLGDGTTGNKKVPVEVLRK